MYPFIKQIIIVQALRVSMEEQRQRHEDETQKAQLESLNEALNKPTAMHSTMLMDTNESGLARVEEAALPVSYALQDNTTSLHVKIYFTQSAVEGDGTQVDLDIIYFVYDMHIIFVKEYLDDMTDEEQLAMALQMSLQAESQEMETDDIDTGGPGPSQDANSESQEFDKLAEDPEFLEV